MVGPITATATPSSIAWAWPAATDPSGIAEYFVSLNGAAPVSNGLSLTLNSTGLSAAQGYSLGVTARDSLGNLTASPLTLSFGTLPPPLPDPTPPVTAASRSYTWLKQAVESWTHRPGFAANPVLDDFIMLAEKRIDGDLKARMQNAVVAIPTIASLNAVLVPPDVAEIRSLTIAGHPPLDYMAPDQVNDQFAAPGVPRHYTVIGAYLYLSPTPNAVYSMQCAYRQMIPSLLDAVDGVNWLIRDHPEIYLAAVMCEALGFTQNESQIPGWETKYANAVAALNKTDWHTGGMLRVRCK